MSGNVYYLLGTLPALQFGETPGLSSEQFLDLCRDLLEPGPYSRIEAAGLAPRESAAFETERRWYDFETDLRNWVVRNRASRLGWEVDRHLHPEGDLAADTERVVAEAFDQKTPADTARRLDEVRFNFLENLGVGHEFDLDRLVLYRLKQLILEKWTRRERNEGTRALEGELERLSDGLFEG